MTSPNQDFVRIAKALVPYLDELVFVGAWCHRLLQFHPLATQPSFAPLVTEDADIATPDRLPARSISLDTALTRGGFKAHLSGDGQHPVTRYYPKDDEKGRYVEFIAALRGGTHTRDGEPDEILRVAGITAQKLRYVDLLLFEPWRLALSEDQGFGDGDNVVVQVANPASYLAQKVLTLNRRQNRSKRPKDALYIHDTLSMFGDAFSQLREQGARVIHQIAPKTRRTFKELRVSLFHDQALIIRTAAIAAATGRANPPSAETIAAVCTMGLENVFPP